MVNETNQIFRFRTDTRSDNQIGLDPNMTISGPYSIHSHPYDLCMRANGMGGAGRGRVGERGWV